MASTLDLSYIANRLEHNAGVFQGLLAAVPEAQARWKPAPDKWSLLEVVNHLADEEGQDFRLRLQLLLEQPGTDWPPIDPPGWAIDRAYNSRHMDESLGRFLAERRASLEWLRGVRDADWDRRYAGAVGARMRAGDLLVSWLEHDLIHIRQVNRLHHEHLAVIALDFSSAYAGDW